jgi:hypothetical protein
MTTIENAGARRSRTLFRDASSPTALAIHGPLERLFVLFSVLIFSMIGICVVLEILDIGAHPLFSVLSLLMFLLVSAMATFMSMLRNISGQLFAIALNLYFLSRIPLAYLLPDQIDYPDVLFHHKDMVERAAVWLIASCLAFIAGLCLPYLIRQTVGRRSGAQLTPEKTHVFHILGTKLVLETMVKRLFPILVLLLFFQGYAIFALGLGLTGGEYARALGPIVRISQLLIVFTPFAIYACLAMAKLDSPSGFRIAVASAFIVFVSFILLASRSSLLSFVLVTYFASRFLGFRHETRHVLTGLAVLGLAVLTYPFITNLRLYFLGVPLDLLQNYDSFGGQLVQMLNRMGVAFESYLLWFKLVSGGLVVPEYTFFVKFAELINSLVPGDIIELQPYVSISKLQVMYGRPMIDLYSTEAFLENLGGHGENAGQFGMAYILFGTFMPAVFLLLGFTASALELSDISPFWKFVLIPQLLASADPLPNASLLSFVLMLYFLAVANSMLLAIGRVIRAGEARARIASQTP